ncbi:unnamed protein product [Trichobilharzia szidati]|nr:unnamed protein product [Trichobilharzia szidati]
MNQSENLKERVRVLQQELERKRILLQKAEKKLNSTSACYTSIFSPVTEERSSDVNVPEYLDPNYVELLASKESLVQSILIQPNDEECCKRIISCILGSCVPLSDFLLITLYDSDRTLSLYALSFCDFDSQLLWEKKIYVADLICLETIVLSTNPTSENVNVGVLLIEKYSAKSIPILVASLFIFSIRLALNFQIDNNLHQSCLMDVQMFPMISENSHSCHNYSSAVVYDFCFTDKNDLLFVLYVPDLLSYSIFQLSSDGKFCLVPVSYHHCVADVYQPKLSSWFTALSHCSKKSSSISQPVCILGIHFSPSSMELIGYLILTNNSDEHPVNDHISEQIIFGKLSQDAYSSGPVKPCSKLLLTISDKRPNFLIFSILVKSCSKDSSPTFYFAMGVVSLDSRPRGSVIRLIPMCTDQHDSCDLELNWSLFNSPSIPQSQCLLRFTSSSEEKTLIVSSWSVDKLATYSRKTSSDVMKITCFSLPEVNNRLSLLILYHSGSILFNQICTFYFTRDVNKVVQLRSS